MLEQNLFDRLPPASDSSSSDDENGAGEGNVRFKKSGIKPNHPARRGTAGTTNGVR